MKKHQKGNYQLYMLFAIVLIFWLLSIFFIFWLFSDSSQRGEFGDMFGAINSLFSGLALAGIIYTVLLQREELNETRQELKITIESQKKSEEFLSKQIITLEKTAKINGLSTIINHYGKLAEIDKKDTFTRTSNIRIAENYKKELEKILPEITSTSTD